MEFICSNNVAETENFVTRPPNTNGRYIDYCLAVKQNAQGKHMNRFGKADNGFKN
jgi:hypothetical protein